MITDRVGDFIVRLSNAAMAKKATVSVPYSAHLEEIAKKLQTLGYIESVEKASKPKRTLEITLVADARGNARIQGVKRVSKPGRRLYVSTRDAHSVKNGMGARILSTPRGILTDAEARKVRQGGENLFEIW
jgi:small subunit ribosomal protein S8